MWHFFFISGEATNKHRRKRGMSSLLRYSGSKGARRDLLVVSCYVCLQRYSKCFWIQYGRSHQNTVVCFMCSHLSRLARVQFRVLLMAVSSKPPEGRHELLPSAGVVGIVKFVHVWNAPKCGRTIGVYKVYALNR